MFGYIRPRKSELLVRELDEYGGVYCALCRTIGREYGLAARLTLNYDCTFYAMLAYAASGGEQVCFTRGRCVVNPLKKCLYCAGAQKELSEAAALTMILSYWKADDNVKDSGFFRGFPYRLVRAFLSRKCRKAAARYPELNRIAAKAANGQREAEKLEQPVFDRCAEPTARMMEHLFLYAAGADESDAQSRVLREVGYYLGRWIYFMDAADDLPKDLKRGAFNPFAIRFHLNRQSTEDARTAARDFANATLNETHTRIGAAADLLRSGCFGSIVRNILLLGLPQMQKERLFRKEDGSV